MKKSLLKKLVLPIALIVVYLCTRLIALTFLPVFADESIYIRWSQLIIDDWQQYLFFPMNDGKTPLFIWLTVGSLKLFADPLLAGRLVSVVAGLIQLLFTVKTIKALKGNKASQVFAAISIIILPYWYFHHRMALMDGLLTALLSGSFYYLFKATQKNKTKKILKLPISKELITAGLFFGLAIWTKIPAILFIPTLVLTSLFAEKKTLKKLPQNLTLSFAAILLGIAVFVALKLHPAFGQLFNRGNDFLYSIDALIETGVWKVLWANIKTTLTTYQTYLTLPVILLPLMGLFQDKHRQKHAVLILSTLSFLAPILLLGKTFYPRYILPSAFTLTLSASLAFGEFFENTQKYLTKKPLISFFKTAVLITILVLTVTKSSIFMLISWKNPDYIPFTLADRVQYLEEWSSGHGTKELTEQILKTAKTNSVAVATEGYFGTLPDAVLMYLHRQDVQGILVQGIGQPVHRLSDDFKEKAALYDENWLVVNSHRELMHLGESKPELLLYEYCRPNNAPCLQIWDVKKFVQIKK